MRCAQPQASGTGSTRYMAGMVAATLIQKVVWRRHTSKNISHFWHVDRNTFNHKSRRITRLLTLKYRKITERPGTPLTALPRPLAGDEGAGRNFCGRTPPPTKKTPSSQTLSPPPVALCRCRHTNSVLLQALLPEASFTAHELSRTAACELPSPT